MSLRFTKIQIRGLLLLHAHFPVTTFEPTIKIQNYYPVKTSVYILVSVFSICAATATSQAQELDYVVPTSSTSSIEQPLSVTTPARIVESKVSNTFSTAYPNASEVVWSKRDNLAWVSFKSSGVSMRAAYNQKAKLDYLITYFYNAQVPSSISNLVRRNGYTQRIIQATEVKKRNAKTYVVKLEDENEFTSLLIDADGVAEVQQTVRKS